MWMFCDITDPLLRSVLFPPPTHPNSDSDSPPPGFLREICDPISDGWFGTGTLAKAKTLMRAKIGALIENRISNDVEFSRVLAFPEHVDEANLNEDLARRFSLEGEGVSSREMQLATDIRAVIRGAVQARAILRRPVGGDTGGGEVGEKKVRWEGEGSEGEEVEMDEDQDERDDNDEIES